MYKQLHLLDGTKDNDQANQYYFRWDKVANISWAYPIINLAYNEQVGFI